MSKNVFSPRRFIAAALLVSAVLLVPSALAVTFTVNSILDQADTLTAIGTCHTVDGTCTLRAAIMQANRTSGAGATIVLPAGTYLLTIPAAGTDGEENGDLNLTTPSGTPVITIVGDGAATTIIDAQQLDRVFHVHLNRTASISGVTIRNGFVTGSFVPGGGIFNEGSLTVSDAVVTLSHTDYIGGGISSANGVLTVTNSTISQNSAGRSGGGIQGFGTVVVLNSTIRQNTTTGVGGGIRGDNLLTVRNSTIHDNTAGYGGGIYNDAQLFVINSTVSQNSAHHDGGGIYNGATANVYNTSIVFNSADTDQLGYSAGGVFNVASFGVFNLRNTLVAGNNVSNSPIYDECTGIFTSFGRNLFGFGLLGIAPCTINNASGGGWTTLNSLNSLGPLQNNGGPTLTQALLPGSNPIDNAIDGGDPVGGCTGPDGLALATDQRGFARVVGVRCDIGAFEFSPATLDVDASITATKYDALTDGLLIIRYMFGLTGTSLTNGALGGTATRTDPVAIKTYLDGIRTSLDIDGNNTTDALTDGLLILRYMFGLRGDALIAGAVDPLGSRHTATDIQTYIQSLMP